jgi:hypothetical protein
VHPTMLLLTVQREREAELERLAIRRPLWRERSAGARGRSERLVAVRPAYCSPLNCLRGLAGRRKVMVGTTRM